MGNMPHIKPQAVCAKGSLSCEAIIRRAWEGSLSIATMAVEGIQLMLRLKDAASRSLIVTIKPPQRRFLHAETPLEAASVILFVMMISQEVAIC